MSSNVFNMSFNKLICLFAMQSYKTLSNQSVILYLFSIHFILYKYHSYKPIHAYVSFQQLVDSIPRIEIKNKSCFPERLNTFQTPGNRQGNCSSHWTVGSVSETNLIPIKQKLLASQLQVQSTPMTIKLSRKGHSVSQESHLVFLTVGKILSSVHSFVFSKPRFEQVPSGLSLQPYSVLNQTPLLIHPKK